MELLILYVFPSVVLTNSVCQTIIDTVAKDGKGNTLYLL